MTTCLPLAGHPTMSDYFESIAPVRYANAPFHSLPANREGQGGVALR